MRAPDSSEPEITSSEPEITEMMIAGGISQVPRQDWDLATATDALTRIYRVMWQLSTMMAHELLRHAAEILGANWSKGADARPFRECRYPELANCPR